MMVEIRPAEISDAQTINEIGNYFIRNTPANFKSAAMTLEQRLDWINSFSNSGRYRLLVATASDRIIGYAGSSRFHDRCAYETSVATAVYVHPESCSNGVGSKLYAQLFEILAHEDIHRVYAGITQPNPASEGLHRKFGFQKVGHFSQAGRKFGQYWDVIWMEKPM